MRYRDTGPRAHPARLLTAYEVGVLVGISSRTVLNLPIRQIKLGPRTIRFRLEDVYEHFGIEDPNA